MYSSKAFLNSSGSLLRGKKSILDWVQKENPFTKE
jgi:hypothetical protein